MPISGSTRSMLRARRKDVNLKPNRRLDRKSSRGMLYENEELRMRTITINAEVEQGQQALKKLRRENEQLRREVWSLRDEYTKMEKLLKDKENDGNESDQENSYSDEYSISEGSQDEEENEDECEEDAGRTGAPVEVSEETDSNKISPDNMENAQISGRFGPRRNSRQLFDGLSVIDEQTEETTQTTERNSRASSVNRGFCYTGEHCEGDNASYPSRPYKKPCTNGFDPDIGNYEKRPSSPYPYTKCFQEPSYQRRLTAIEEPMFKPQTHIPTAPTNGWIYPTDSIPLAAPFIQDRLGPDVYITDGYHQHENEIDDVQSQIKKIEISQQHCPESSPKHISDYRTDAKMGQHISATCEESPSEFRTADSEASCPVSCQNACCEHRVDYDNDHDNDNGLEFEMPRDKFNAARQPYQSRLCVTLKVPDTRPTDAKRPIQHNLANHRLKTDYPIVKDEKPIQSYPIVVNHHHRSHENILDRLTSHPQKFQTFPTAQQQRTAAIRTQKFQQLQSLSPAENAPTSRVPVPVAVPIVPDIPVRGDRVEKKDTGSYSDGGKSSSSTAKIPPQPPPRTSSCPNSLNIQVPSPPIGVTAQHFRSFRRAKIGNTSNVQTPVTGSEKVETSPQETNPLLNSEPIATSSPTLRNKFGPRRSEDRSASRLRKQQSQQSASFDETTTDDGLYMIGAGAGAGAGAGVGTRRPPRGWKAFELDNLNARKWRKHSQASVSSMDAPLTSDRKVSSSRLGQLNNISISSSSGLDSPTKLGRPHKRRVSIKFNRHKHASDADADDRPGILANHRKSRNEDSETISERERTNSVSSRTSSIARRKLSSSSSRTIFREEKIPWCGCWGNGCV